MSNFSLSTSLGRFRLISIAEGISYILLLGVAVPLKRIAGIEDAVKYPGWVHGLLFIAYIFSLIDVAIARRWPIKWILLAFVASLLPFGPFVFDAKILKKDAQRGDLNA